MGGSLQGHSIRSLEYPAQSGTLADITVLGGP